MLLTIKNALIATMNNANQVFFGDIESDGHNITRINARPDVTQVLVGPITQRPAEGGGIEIDGNGCLALPGLVNGHIHSYRNALRFAPEEVRLPRQADGQPHLTLAEAEAILRLSYLEGIRAGVTFCSDFPQWLTIGRHEDFPATRPFEIAHEIGIKGCIRVVLSHDSYEEANRVYFTNPGGVVLANEGLTCPPLDSTRDD